MIRQSIAWWCFVPGKMEARAFVKAVAAAGYPAIDLAPEDQWSLVKDHGLAVSAIGGHNSIEHGLNRPENHGRIESELKRNIDLAATQGIPNLICFSGNRAGQPDAEGIANTAVGLARVAPHAEQAGVTLILEILNSRVDHPDYQCDYTDYAIDVCRRVNSPRVKVLFDIYHVQIMEGDVIRHMKDALPYTGHYHTAGNPGRNDLDDSQEIHYPAIWKAIAATDYSGYIAHEFIPRADPTRAIQDTRRYCAAWLS